MYTAETVLTQIGGEMGRKGPVPKRAEDRLRHQTREEQAVDKVESGGLVEAPDPDPNWDPVATRWYLSALNSAGARFYEQSDVAHLYMWTDILSRQLQSGKPSSNMMLAFEKAASELLVTEGARRRNRVEVQKVSEKREDPFAGLSRMETYQRMYG